MQAWCGFGSVTLLPLSTHITDYGFDYSEDEMEEQDVSGGAWLGHMLPEWMCILHPPANTKILCTP